MRNVVKEETRLQRKRMRLRWQFWACVAAPVIIGILNGLLGRGGNDSVLLALAKIDASIMAMTFWLLAGIIAMRLDALPEDPEPSSAKDKP